jgi:hypothetical protein
LESLTLILHKEMRNVILVPSYAFKHVAYGFLFEELNNDFDYKNRILCSATVMFWRENKIFPVTNLYTNGRWKLL